MQGTMALSCAVLALVYFGAFTFAAPATEESLKELDQKLVGGGGVSSLLKDLNCGAANTAVPFFLTIPGYGLGRTMVDVGLHTGKETVAATTVGFTVYSFEPIPNHMDKVVRALNSRELDFQLIELGPAGELIEPLRPPKPGRGIAYLFAAAAGRTHEKRMIGLSGPGSSFVEEHVLRDTNSEMLEVQIVPLSDYVKTDVHFFKSDTQGFEMDVLAGARALYDNFTVRQTTVEFFTKGLEGAGASPRALLDMLSETLGLFCFTSEPRAQQNMKAGHPEEKEAFLKAVQEHGESMSSRWGFFDDLTCVHKSVWGF